jgi:dTDP-4-dehydrorhamnose reductase
MKRLMVSGAGGMTGSEVSERARRAGWEVAALTRAELDVTDPASVDAAADDFRPKVIVNCAAYTAVDRAESEPDIAAAINGDGARNIARTSAAAGIPLIHLSTDYVFSGGARTPYQPDAETGPICVYGRTKLAGENAVREEAPSHVIVRTSWVFSHRGSNFVRTMLRLGAERDELRVVNDQVGRPTSAGDLAEALLVVAAAMLENREVSGTHHFANAGETSWFGFAQAIIEESGARTRSPRVVPIPTTEFPTAARRPAYSVLDTGSFTSLFGVTPRPWRGALRETIALL